MSVSRNVFNKLLTPRFTQRFSGNSYVNLFAPYMIVDKHCSDVCCDKLLVPEIDRNQKQWHNKFYLQSVSGKRPILSTENIKICGWITKLEAIKMQYVCIFFHIRWMSAEFWIFNFPRYCSNMPKVRWTMLYGFWSKLHTLFSSAKLLRIG